MQSNLLLAFINMYGLNSTMSEYVPCNARHQQGCCAATRRSHQLQDARLVKAPDAGSSRAGVHGDLHGATTTDSGTTSHQHRTSHHQNDVVSMRSWAMCQPRDDIVHTATSIPMQRGKFSTLHTTTVCLRCSNDASASRSSASVMSVTSVMRASISRKTSRPVVSCQRTRVRVAPPASGDPGSSP
jgi:hypothetical protein